jgi:hypothetical protein
MKWRTLLSELVCPDKLSSASRWESGRGKGQAAA